MLKECVVLDGRVINIGPWDYKVEQIEVGSEEIEVEPAEYDGEGSLIREAVFERVPVYEDQPTNPLPDGAEVVEMEIVEGEDGGLYPADYVPEPDELEQLRAENTELKLALTELAEAQEADKTEMQLALAEIAELISGGESDG
ncbi:hypothetical protein ACE3MQ_06080 [Paenibacillus lentus]|uniref:hypothetical protein n=1 Tax=Paenibacillus lentus TaxID=1338368 RepID=UPI003653EF52